ncbi:DUF2971 domain-containing protein [Desulfobacter latus]|uniref:DUF2971 domain-containing protein n=1 Tax=Desulfobacter latus TaxID=2292 RepID=A0A850T8U5_9BACT|nr:DUF2971 domain-containing protein [Desulfobacter latus]NWH05625.1 DUF2971 domain-containing protein [Desulfobacter latus]
MKDSIGFKFRQINKRLIESLITGEVYFSSPEKLNDPFDCQIDIKKSLKVAIGMVERNQKQILLSIQERLDTLFSEVERDITTFGVWSCSLELKNSLMWSHYGDEHRGICLTYKLSEKFTDHTLGEVIGLHPVEYAENPITDWFIEQSKITGEPPSSMEFITSLIVKLLISKDVCWKYEKEGRVISKTQGLKEIGKPALQQVCFGLRTPENDKNLIKHILSSHGYKATICEMIRSDNDFGLEAKEI